MKKLLSILLVLVFLLTAFAGCDKADSEYSDLKNEKKSEDIESTENSEDEMLIEGYVPYKDYEVGVSSFLVAIKMKKHIDIDKEEQIEITVSYGVSENEYNKRTHVSSSNGVGVYFSGYEDVALKKMTTDEYFESGQFYKKESVLNENGEEIDEKYEFVKLETMVIDTKYIRDTYENKTGKYGKFYICAGEIGDEENPAATMYVLPIWISVENGVATFYGYREYYTLPGRYS